MKKLISLIAVLAMCLALAACGNAPAEPQATTSSPVVIMTAPAPVVETQPVTEPAPVAEVHEIPMGGTMSTEFVEMTFSEVIVAKDVKYSVKTGNVTRTTGPNPVDGQQFICLTGKIKNISTSPLPVYDFFIGDFNLDGYHYAVDANDIDILDGEGQTESTIDPLMEYTFRLYVAIPDSLAESHSSCVFNFGFYDGFDNQELSYNRAFEENPIALCPYQFIVTVK